MVGMDPSLPPRPDQTEPPASVADDWSQPIPRRRGHRAIAVVVALALVSSSLFAGAAFFLRDAFRPSGAPSEHHFLMRMTQYGTPLRWNPCDPIHYVVNPGQALPGSVADVHEAVARVSAATGIAFAYDGLTDEEPTQRRDPYLPERYPGRWAPVLVAWVDPDASDVSFEDDEHVAAGVARPLTPPTGEELIVSGWIAVNEEDPNPPGFSSPGAQGPTILHEWGHILGLGHFDAAGQLMEPSGGHMTDFGPGDLAGLEELGRSSGCLPVPSPQG